MQIVIDDLSGKEIASLLREHIEDMQATSPPESKHALDLSGLQQDDITFWSIYDNEQLVGCGALKELDENHGEIKSMRTANNARGKGAATLLLRHILNEASKRHYKKLSLETGSMEYFAPARALYTKFGFMACGPFGAYKEDPNSIFMQLILEKLK